MVNNADRVLFGASKSNAVSGVMATALLTINNTAGKMTAAEDHAGQRHRADRLAAHPADPSTMTKSGSSCSCH